LKGEIKNKNKFSKRTKIMKIKIDIKNKNNVLVEDEIENNNNFYKRIKKKN